MTTYEALTQFRGALAMLSPSRDAVEVCLPRPLFLRLLGELSTLRLIPRTPEGKEMASMTDALSLYTQCGMVTVRALPPDTKEGE